MGKLLDKQSERDPVAYTHFDCWFPYDPEVDDEDEWNSLESFSNAGYEELAPIFDDLVENWAKTLGTIRLHPQRVSEMHYGTWMTMMENIGFDGTMKLVLFEIMRDPDYDVYYGYDFVEIYKVEHDLFVENPND